MGYSPGCRKELDVTEDTHPHTPHHGLESCVCLDWKPRHSTDSRVTLDKLLNHLRLECLDTG